MFDPNQKLSKSAIKAILERESFYSSAFKEEKEKSKPEKLSYEEELLLKYPLPVAFFIYVLRALSWGVLILIYIVVMICAVVFWYGYIPYLIAIFLTQNFSHLYTDININHNWLVIIMLWLVKDFCLYLLYENLTSNLDRVNKIKEENKELFDD